MTSAFLQEIRFHYWIFLLTLTLFVGVLNSCTQPQPAIVLETVKTPIEATILIQEDTYTLEQKECVIEALYHEVRGENKEAIIAVASVIKNRVESKRYPNSYCEVIQQPKQFSYRNHLPVGVVKKIQTNGYQDEKKLDEIRVLADKFIYAKIQPTLPSNVLHYARHDVSNYWTRKKQVVAQAGKHVFYN
jgi:spore germination cell wall hydrolase CwlJ-like protein